MNESCRRWPRGWLLFVGIVAVCSAPTARAEHGMPGIGVSPGSGTIPTNARLRLLSFNGVAWAVSHLKRRTGQARIYLRSGKAKVSLRIVDSFDDMEGGPRQPFAPTAGYGDSVLVFAPGAPLRPATRYDLVLERAPGTPRHSTEELASYTTASGPDTQAPRWSEAPFVEWRPDTYEEVPENDFPTIVATLASERDVIDMIVVLTPMAKGKPKRMLLVFDEQGPPAPRNVVEVDRSDELCLVGHVFDTEADIDRLYRVELTAVDSGGKRSPAPGHPLMLRWRSGLSVTVCLRRG